MAKVAFQQRVELINTIEASKGISREEAVIQADTYLSEYGIFVGLYNKISGSSLSVAEALETSQIKSLFESTKQTVSSTKIAPKSNKASKRVNTKLLSYEEFTKENGTSVAHAIYKFLKGKGTSMSRNEIAKEMNLRLSTVCGQVHKLIESGIISVDGTKTDELSNREVETVVCQ